MRIRTIIGGAAVLVGSFFGALALMDVLWPQVPAQPNRPALVAVPPLQPLTRTSTVLAPAAVAMTAIRDALEAQAPRDLTGKPTNPVSKLLSSAQLTFNVTRSPLTVAGQSNVLNVSTQLSGTFQAIGTLAGGANSVTSGVGNTIGNLVGGSVGQQVQNLAGKAFDQHTDIHGTVQVTSRPAIAPNWRLSPNLSGQVNVVDVVLPIAGLKLDVAGAVKPVLDGAVRDQMTALDAKLRNDPFIEAAARSEWVKLCSSTSLGAAGQGMPKSLALKSARRAPSPRSRASTPTRSRFSSACRPRRASCRARPSRIARSRNHSNIVPQANEGSVSIGVPIDIPFTEVNRLLEAQIKGKTFPEDGSGEFAVTIKQATIAASGDRLLITLFVNAKKRGFFAIGADATVYVYGRPVLDADRQILRFTDLALDVQSEAVFGLLGAAAKAAVPYLQNTLADKAVIDLKPFAADARKQMAAAVTSFAAQGNGMTAKVAIDDLRLTGVAYDDKTLRVIADVNGAVSVAISSLSGM